jgi:putative membrane protein
MRIIVIIRFIQGFCMALADSVPGVSGGTIAFLLGFYDDFIGSLNNLISGNREERKEAIKFLLKIGVGWVIGLILAILFITSVFESYIYQISSLFMGFIIFAIPIIIKEEKECLIRKYSGIIFLILGCAFVVAISYFSGSTILGDGVDLAAGKFGVGVAVLLFFAGVIAISAMVLPGISGSTILMIFGLYVPITTAVKDILHLKFEYILAIAIFALGVISGAVGVVKIIKNMLEKFRTQTVYFIIGMMFGSLYSIALGPTTLKDEKGVLKGLKMLDLSTFSILFFLIGGVIIVGLQILKNILEAKTEQN